MRRKLNASSTKRKKSNASELRSRKKHGNRNAYSAKKQSARGSESAQPLQKIRRKLLQDS